MLLCKNFRAEGLELSLMVLETIVLPLNYTRKLKHKKSPGRGTRTLINDFEDHCSAIKLYPQIPWVGFEPTINPS